MLINCYCINNKLLILESLIIFVILNHDWKFVSNFSKQGPLIAWIWYEHYKTVFNSNKEPCGEWISCRYCLTQRWFENVWLVLAIICTQKHLAIVCANQDHTSFQRPLVACKVGWDVTTFFKVVNLGVVLSEKWFIFFLFVLQVDKCVLRTCNKYRWWSSIPRWWIEGNLKILGLDSDWALLTDICYADHLGAFPVPEDQFPVWLPSQSDDKFVVCWAECTSHKLLWLICIWLFQSFW